MFAVTSPRCKSPIWCITSKDLFLFYRQTLHDCPFAVLALWNIMWSHCQFLELLPVWIKSFSESHGLAHVKCFPVVSSGSFKDLGLILTVFHLLRIYFVQGESYGSGFSLLQVANPIFPIAFAKEAFFTLVHKFFGLFLLYVGVCVYMWLGAREWRWLWGRPEGSLLL